MKKSLLFMVLLPVLAVAASAQESRQDVSVSGAALIPWWADGAGTQLHATTGWGGLISYRYLLTPHSGLEANYQYNQNLQHFTNDTSNYEIHSRFMETSVAYVYSFNFRNFNPFLEGGVGEYMFLPIDDSKTDDFGLKHNLDIGALYGAGIAYELSPSWDLRAEYRGIIVKTPTFGQSGLNTERYYNIFDPVIGVAYHF